VILPSITPTTHSLSLSLYSQALTKGKILQANGRFIPAGGFSSRKEALGKRFTEGEYLKNPNQSPLDMFSDPSNMNGMMDGMMKTFAAIIPQSIIFAWVSYFFTGFVLSMSISLLVFSLLIHP